jgi:transposase
MRQQGRGRDRSVVPEQYELFVGIDWASESHEVCVLNAERRVIDRKTIEHSGVGMAQLCDLLSKLSQQQPSRVAVAIETPRGAVVETLVERQFKVFSINPKQMDRFRDRHTVSGAKDDRKDAFVLADSLRTDQHLFHAIELDEAQVIRLRELSRTEEDIVQEQTRTGNQLRELLRRYYPQMLHLCPKVNEDWFWELIEMAPTPSAVAKLSRFKVERLLKGHRIRRLSAEQIITALKVPPLHLAPGAVEAASEHVLLQLPRLRLLQQQRNDVARRMQSILDEMSEPEHKGEHRDAAIILSLPGVGRVVAATMLAEASQALAQRDYHALRSYAGTAPVTRQSGKTKMVLMRHSCNGRMRNALYHWSRVSMQHDDRSREHYAQLRKAGHKHGRALRGVVDRLLPVLMAMLKSGTLYDPEKRIKADATARAVQPAKT